MKKALPYMGAAVAALAMVWSSPVKAQDQFKDLDPKHWAYEAVNELQQKGILKGYPNGFFQGKRTLTRYEFAIALKRALDTIGTAKGADGKDGQQGPPGPAGEAGPKGDKGDPGMTPEEVANLKRLTDEFRNELTSLGASVRDINARLDALSKEVASLNDKYDKLLKWSGVLGLYVRTDRSRGIFVDQSGAFRPAATSQLNSPDVLHDLHLKATGNVGGGVTAKLDLVFSNYLSYRGGTLSQGAVAAHTTGAGGASTLAEQITPYQAQVDIPLNLGKEGVLTVGRYLHKGSDLTYARPDLDVYFDTEYDNGYYSQDGARLKAKFGSVTASLFGASYSSPTLSTGVGGNLAFNRPLIGSGPIGNAGFLLGFKPSGINPLGNSLAATNAAGVSIGVPLFKFGELNVGATYLTAGTAPTPATPFSSVVVYDAGVKLRPFGRFQVDAEAAKSVTQNGFQNPDGQNNEDNNAYKLNVGYASGPIDIKAGYLYIDPRYSAPGAWLRIGNWTNPTDVRGPFVNVGYSINKALHLSLGGNFLEGARNRPGYLNIADTINSVRGGLNYKINKMFSTSFDYEGVFYDLSAATTGLATSTKPVEQYLTIGAGINLSGNTALKLAYQMINFQNLGGAFGTGTGYGAGVGGGGNTYNASVFTTSLVVHF